MKKITFLMASAALTLVGATSCSNHDDVYMSLAEQKQAQYDAAFVSAFGQVDPLQDWGFGTATTKAATRSGQKPNGSENFVTVNNKKYDMPSEISEDEINDVMEYFRTHQFTQSESFDYTMFFVQHVGQGTTTYNYTITGDDGKEYTYYYDRNDTQESQARSLGTVTDVYKYMNQINVNKEDIPDWNAGVHPTLLMYGLTSPLKFGYKSSNTSSSSQNYVIIKYKGNYYLGFDYEGRGDAQSVNNANTTLDKTGKTYEKHVLADGYYDDWVIKLIPAEQEITRVFAEDLGTIGDWDFNDVVFDVADGKVTLQAAGGTLPIYLEINNTRSDEVHKLFGVDTSVMVNTGAGESKDPVELVTNFSGDASQIKIFVVENGKEREITALQGKPAAKFAVKKAIAWPSERVNITTVYPKFSNYVSDTSYNETWYLNIE